MCVWCVYVYGVCGVCVMCGVCACVYHPYSLPLQYPYIIPTTYSNVAMTTLPPPSSPYPTDVHAEALYLPCIPVCCHDDQNNNQTENCKNGMASNIVTYSIHTHTHTHTHTRSHDPHTHTHTVTLHNVLTHNNRYHRDIECALGNTRLQKPSQIKKA